MPLRTNLFILFAVIGAIFALLGVSPAAAKSADIPECKLDADVASYLRGDEDGADQTGIIENASTAGNSETAPTLLGKCGRGTELIDTMKSSAVRVKLGGGSFLDFYPLLLTDKSSGAWTCNKIKIRSACVVAQRDNGDGTVDLTMKAMNVPKAAQETHRILADGTVQYPPDGRFFVLMPRLKKNKHGTLTDRVDAILEAAAKANCSSKSLECKAKQDVFVERAALQELRRLRMPRILSAAERRADARDLSDLTRQLGDDKRLVHLAIAASEVGWTPAANTVRDSPFEIVDAILGNSGPSFGIHQIDLATNGSRDVIPFRKIMPAVLGEMPSNAVPTLQPPTGILGSKPFRFEKPIRGWDIRLTADFYRAAPSMVRQIRAPGFRNTYGEQYREFLDAATGCMAALAGRGGIFAASKVSQLYVMDVDNQFGSGRSTRLARFAMTLDQTDLKHAEEAMRDFMIANSSYGSTPEGAHDIRRRFTNIRDIVGSANPSPIKRTARSQGSQRVKTRFHRHPACALRLGKAPFFWTLRIAVQNPISCSKYNLQP